jgi:hypothetical protein
MILGKNLVVQLLIDGMHFRLSLDSSVLIKLSIFSTHPLGQGNKC